MQVWDEQAERYAGQSEISISTESMDAGMLGLMVLEARPILCGQRSDASALILSLSDSLRFLNNFTCMDRVCPSSCVASSHQRVLHRTHHSFGSILISAFLRFSRARVITSRNSAVRTGGGENLSLGARGKRQVV